MAASASQTASPGKRAIEDSTSSVSLEPHVIAILANRIDSIAQHMTHVLTRSARSSVMSAARDLSTAVCDAQGNALALPNGFPVHVANMSLVAKYVLETHGDDLRPGDAYLHNSPYHGNTHMADHTIIVPVFHEGSLMFMCACRGHQADIGNAVPTTYDERARDIYEEGALCFPAVTVQRDYRDVDDIIRMASARIRVPDVWYGDFLAAVGAARIGERSLMEVLERYGADTISAFCDEWHAYGARRMAAEIAELPAGTWRASSTHDAIPGLLDEELTVRVAVTTEPEKGRILVDFTENGDPVACGLNLCEATVLSAGRTGILNRLAADVPLCEGALSVIDVRMKDPGVIGKAAIPFSSSVATTNLADRAILAVQNAWEQIDSRRGMGEGAEGGGPEDAVISGIDSRSGRRFVTQLIAGDTGGGAVFGHDGYVDYATSNGGMQGWNSVEVVEQKYPVLYVQQELIADSAGAGQWDGAPGCRTVIGVLDDPVTFAFLGDNESNPPRGAAGGSAGRAARAAILEDWTSPSAGERGIRLFGTATLEPGQAIVAEVSGGGGYGDPLERDPERVRYRVQEGWLTADAASSRYGVVVDCTASEVMLDVKATSRRRAALQRELSGTEV